MIDKRTLVLREHLEKVDALCGRDLLGKIDGNLPNRKTMGDSEIKGSSWRFVEVGRIVLLQKGPSEGKLATIVEIIDHKRALIDGPSDTATAVPRQAISLSNLILTPIVLENLPRGARTGTVKALWEKAGIETKWQESAWAKKRQQRERRQALTDFERFKVMRLRKQARYEVRKSLAKISSAAS
ncbi:hypothetical protein K3495_g1212 [Podosphaera aphanis]|nr:hypothetical protein K3495_g1212 [Podosphaera aphanis]